MFAFAPLSRVVRVPLVAALIVALVALFALAAVPGRAAADDPVVWTPVTDEASLQAALTAQDMNIVLANDITVSSVSLTDSWATTINLAGHNLSGRNLSVALGLTVVNEDSDGNPLTAGILTMHSTQAGLAGISVNSVVPGHSSAHGQFDAEGVTIVASGAWGGAGIGGDNGQDSGTITINNSTILATGGDFGAGIGGGDGGAAGFSNSQGIPAIDVSNSLVASTAGEQSAALGGGNDGNVLALITDDSPGNMLELTASGVSVVGPGLGGAYQGAGNFKLAADILLGASEFLDVPTLDSGDVPTFGAAGGAVATLSGDGNLTGDGTLYNWGAITLPAANISSDLTIAVNNYDVDFDGGPDAVPSHRYLHVLAPTLASAGVASLPVGSALEGYVFRSWGDGGTTKYDVNTSLSPIGAHFYASYTGLWSFDSSSEGQLSGTFVAGSTVGVPLVGEDIDGNKGDESPFATVTSTGTSDGSGDVITGDQITFGKAGPRTITARLTSHTIDPVVSSVTVIAGPLAALAVTPSATSTTSGSQLSFQVEARDAGGDDLGDVTGAATLASDHPGDSVDGDTVTFSGVGVHRVTATDGAFTSYVDVTVGAGSFDHYVLRQDSTGDFVGVSRSFSLSTADAAGDILTTLTTGVKITSSSSKDKVTGASVLFGSTGTRTIKATIGAAALTIPVTVVLDAATATLTAPTSQNAGKSTVVTVQLHPGLSGITPKGTVRVYYGSKYVTGTATGTSSVKLTIPVLDVAGNYPLHVLFGGSATYGSLSTAAQAYTIAPLATSKIRFQSSSTSAYLRTSVHYQVDATDIYGNLTTADVAAVVMPSGSGATGDGSETISYPKTGKVTLKAVWSGHSITKTISVVKDTSRATYPTTSIVASIPSSITVAAPIGGSGYLPTGKVTLHFGSATLSGSLVTATGDPSTVQFALPALKVGNYTVYATYSGDSEYNSSTTTKHTIKVVPGALARLSFVKPPASVTAGGAVTYSVLGYDVNNNLIGSETSHATFSLDTLGTGETVIGSKVKFTQAGSRVVTATVGSVTKDIPITVAHNVAATLDVVVPTVHATAGVPLTFTATAADAYGNPLGAVSTLLTGSSTVSSDHFVKNVVTMTKAGTRTISLKDGAAHESFAVVVDPDAVVIGKLAFESSATRAYPGAAFSVQVDYADKFGNPVNQVSPSGVYTATGSGVVVDNAAATITFGTVGNHTVTATYGGVHISKVVGVVKDTAPTMTWAIATLYTNAPISVGVQLVAGPSGLMPMGTVTVHYETHSVTSTLVAGQATVVVPQTAAGSYVTYVTYSGDSSYNSKTSTKVTVHSVPQPVV